MLAAPSSRPRGFYKRVLPDLGRCLSQGPVSPTADADDFGFDCVETRQDDNELEQRAGGLISKGQLSEAQKGWVGDKDGWCGRDTRDAWTNQAGVLVREESE